MISEGERADLRREAVAQWEVAKRLVHTSLDLVGSTQDLVEETRGSRQRSRDLAGRHDATWAAVATRVDRYLAEATTATRGWEGSAPIGLVAAADPQRILALRRDTRTGCHRIVGAQDAAIAIAVGIAVQPDVGVVEDDLPPFGGLQTLHNLRSYAPRTKLILLTDDPGLDRSAQELGAHSLGRDATQEAIAHALSARIAG